MVTLHKSASGWIYSDRAISAEALRVQRWADHEHEVTTRHDFCDRLDDFEGQGMPSKVTDRIFDQSWADAVEETEKIVPPYEVVKRHYIAYVLDALPAHQAARRAE